VWDPDEGRVISVATHSRAAIKPGVRVSGPALILEAGTTTFVTAGFEAGVDAGGALVLERKKPRRGKA
jgi:N-methylhydantoinase A